MRGREGGDGGEGRDGNVRGGWEVKGKSNIFEAFRVMPMQIGAKKTSVAVTSSAS